MNYKELPNFEHIWQETLKWQPDETKQIQYQKLYEQILIGNRKLNLTRITEPVDFWEKHLWDSLAGIINADLEIEIETKEDLKVIDIGTGGGFPGIPIAIAFPWWRLTLVDSTHKKIAFVRDLSKNLGLKNVTTVTTRAEQLGQENNYREAYNLALIRAVAQPSVCAEYTLPFVKVGGLAILYRGHWSDEDSIQLKPALEKLGGKLESVRELITPLSNSIRNCIYLRKISPMSPQFPRAVGVPNQHPL
jgi:16S rRNA (guanine527-N7)-methyltransferase